MGIQNGHLSRLLSLQRRIIFILIWFSSFNMICLYNTAQTPGKSVAIIVDSIISEGIIDELNRFISDLDNENYNVVLKKSTYQSPEEVRAYLQDLYSSVTPTLIGAVLMGNIPLARQYFRMTYTNPDLSPTDHIGLSTQFFSDLDGGFDKNNPSYPDIYSSHYGDIESEIWVSILPYYIDLNMTITKIRQYLDKNHQYRTGNSVIQEGFLYVNEHYNATSLEEYDTYYDLAESGTYSWYPFTEWGNVGIYFNNTIGRPDANYAYENELNTNKYRFATLAAHGTYFANGQLSITDIRSMTINPIFIWLGGCNTGNIDYDENIATEIVYSTISNALVTKGGTTNVGGLGTNENGYFGKNIATTMMDGMSLGESYLDHNNTPLIYPWSDSYELHNAFSIFIGDLSLTLCLNPEKVTLLYPENDQTVFTFPLEFKWNSSHNSESYQIQISQYEDFRDLMVNDSNMTDTVLDVGFLESHSKYYWRVRGLNPSFIGFWSTTSSFSLNSPPDSPELNRPANLETNVPINPSFIWEEQSNVDSFQLQISFDESFLTVFIDTSNIIGDSIRLYQFNYNTTYYWRVKAFNSSGESTWSQVFSFTTSLPVPLTPVPFYPPDLSFGLDITLELLWEQSEFAETYHLQVAEDSLFSILLIDSTNIHSTSLISENFNPNTDYYWRVKAFNSIGESLWSQVFYFTTFLPVPLPPIPLYPPDLTFGLETILELSWEQSEFAETYHLQVAEDSLFSILLIDSTDIPSTSLISENFGPDTKYYWRVKASNINGESDWCATCSFGTLDNMTFITDYQKYNTHWLGNNYPNPFHEITSVNYYLYKSEDVIFIVTDVSGKTVCFREVNNISGNNKLFLNSHNWESGIYVLKMRVGSSYEFERYLMKR